MTDGSTSKKVFIGLLLQLTRTRYDEQLKAEATTMMAAVREYFFHTFELFTFIAFMSGRAERLPVQNRVLAARGMKLTTDLHPVLKLRNNGIIPSLPPCAPSLLYNGHLVFPGGKERSGRDADPSPLLVP